MRFLGLSVLVVIILSFFTGCNKQALEQMLTTSESENIDVSSSPVSSDPKGPSFALTQYEKNTASVPQSCELSFASATALPEDFYVDASEDVSMSFDKVLDICKAQFESAEELGRVFFSKNEPVSFGAPGGPPASHPHGVLLTGVEGPPSHIPQGHSSAPIELSEFLQSALEFDSLDDADSFLSCVSTGWKDVFDSAVGTHGVSESGYISSEEDSVIHVHYDLTVMGSTNYVVQLATVEEISGHFFVVMSSGMDASQEDAEEYTHLGVKETCRNAGVISGANGRGFIALPESN